MIFVLREAEVGHAVRSERDDVGVAGPREVGDDLDAVAQPGRERLLAEDAFWDIPLRRVVEVLDVERLHAQRFELGRHRNCTAVAVRIQWRAQRCPFLPEDQPNASEHQSGHNCC